MFIHTPVTSTGCRDVIGSERKGQRMHTPSFLEKGWFTLPQQTIARPSTIIGEGGSGKTETLLKIAYLVTTAYEFDIILIDAKGDDDLTPRFVATMQKAGKKKIKLFPTSSYYGWSGDTRALYNRLMAVQTYSEPYYENMASMLLDLALNAPGYTPRSSEELLKNLTLEQLRLRYRGLPEQTELDRMKPEDANGVYNRYRAFFRALHGKLDAGFTVDESDATYIKLDTVAFAKEASSIGRYIVEDIAHYITVRKPKNKKVLIIIDEVSALAIENIANLSERLRSFGGAMMLACQSEEGLAKTQDERNRILKTSHMLILHTSNAPESLIERAGKHKQVNAGWSRQGEEATGYGTLSMKDEYIIPPDEARRLNVGECFVIAQGYGYKVHVAPVQIDAASLEQAQVYIEQEARDNNAVQAMPHGDALEQTQSNPTQENNGQQSGLNAPDLL
jgi:Type IV secretion-system coupling protein DNA-binding domain